MIRFVVLLSCVVLVLAGVKNRLDCVIGGEAAVGQFPYQVSIRNRTNGQHNCGGSIITYRHILTAAHCVNENFVREFYVVVGATYISFGGQAYEVETAKGHSGYNPEYHENDIAILKTASDIIFNDFVQPIPLQTKEVPDGAPMVGSGWGYTNWPNYRLPDNLLWTVLTNFNINQCMQLLYPYQIFHTQICTYTRPGHGICRGDSGGPLVHAGHLAGIVSYYTGLESNPCSQAFPDIYTKVASYVPWITDFINNNM